MYAYIDSDEKAELPTGTFGRYSDEYMFDTGHAYLEGRHLPRAGGWDDQAADWRDALMVWLAYYGHVRAELDKETAASGDRAARRRRDEAVADALFDVDDDDGDGNWLFDFENR